MAARQGATNLSTIRSGKASWATSVDIVDAVGPVTAVVVAVGVPESETQSTIVTAPDAFAVVAAPYEL